MLAIIGQTILASIAISNVVDASLYGTKLISLGETKKLRNSKRPSSPDNPNNVFAMAPMLRLSSKNSNPVYLIRTQLGSIPSFQRLLLR